MYTLRCLSENTGYIPYRVLPLCAVLLVFDTVYPYLISLVSDTNVANTFVSKLELSIRLTCQNNYIRRLCTSVSFRLIPIVCLMFILCFCFNKNTNNNNNNNNNNNKHICKAPY